MFCFSSLEEREVAPAGSSVPAVLLFSRPSRPLGAPGTFVFLLVLDCSVSSPLCEFHYSLLSFGVVAALSRTHASEIKHGFTDRSGPAFSVAGYPANTSPRQISQDSATNNKLIPRVHREVIPIYFPLIPCMHTVLYKHEFNACPKTVTSHTPRNYHNLRVLATEPAVLFVS